ncbi:MAG: HAMP domain-containing histidine kinase, partial [Candidatus Delongbacteria bacterium]|nr:HAMP domain-containing histidine kinase [Candidatus Delongbacteria bacterium]
KKANLILAEKNNLITIQKEQLAATLIQLEKANATKDKFFRIIHHDLVNPFTAIYSTADLLYNYYDNHTEDKRKEYLKFILTGSNRFLNLMNNLFEWVKSQTGTLEFKPENIRLLNIVESELEVLKITANKKEISINLDIPDDNTSVFADKNLLSIILRNLVSNAIKFTYNQGTVSIKSRKLDKYIEIEIADTGIGIDPECIEKIFDVDSKLTTKGTNNEEGTGFGLALCKEFVEINNGKIMVKSELGVGSSFLFTIPSTEKI